MQTNPENPHNRPICAECSIPTTKKCGQCKAIAIYSKTCFKKIRKKHKNHCRSVSAAANAAKDLHQPHFKKSIPVSIDPGALIEINRRALVVYRKYGIKDPPTPDCTLSKTKLAEFFLPKCLRYIIRVHRPTKTCRCRSVCS